MESPRTDRIWVAGGLLCLLLAATLAFRAQGRHPADPPAPPWGHVAAGGGERAFVAVVFRLADCGGSIERLTAWNAVAREGSIPVLGLVLDGPRDSVELRKALDGSGIEFPLRRVEPRYFVHLLRTMGVAATPAALVVDGRGRVRLVVPLETGLRPDEVRSALAAASVGRRPAGGE
jgi:hypothetical protein